MYLKTKYSVNTFLDRTMDSDGNYTIITQLLRIVQDIDEKVTKNTEEMEKQSERLSVIETKMEAFQQTNKQKSWLKNLFGK